VVGTLPVKNLAYTNFVYVSVAASKLLPQKSKENYVILKDMVFIAKAHEGIPEKEIGMNSLQRECSKVSSGSPVAVAIFEPNATNSPAAISLKTEVDTLDKRRLQIKEEELQQFVRERFKGHVFTVDQVVCADFNGAPIRLHVRAIETPAEEKKT